MKGPQSNLSQKERNIMLKDAFDSKNHELIKIAIDAGAEINKTALAVAVTMGDVEISKLIIDKGQFANVEKVLSYAMSSALNARTINEQCIKLLLENGAKVRAANICKIIDRANRKDNISKEKAVILLKLLIKTAETDEIVKALSLNCFK